MTQTAFYQHLGAEGTSRRHSLVALDSCLPIVLAGALIFPRSVLAQDPQAPPRDHATLTEWLAQDDSEERLWTALEAGFVRDLPSRRAITRSLMERVSPEAFEQKLESSPELTSETMTAFADVIDRGERSREAIDYLAAAARSRSYRLSARGEPWERQACSELLGILFVDPERFVTRSAFRDRILDIVRHGLHPRTDPTLRDLLLFSVNHVPGVDFEASERIELAWGAARRSSDRREREYRAEDALHADDVATPIEASVYSLPSAFFEAGEARAFLEGVRNAAPERMLVALVDLPLLEKLHDLDSRVSFLETFGRDYTPWIRDPLSLVSRRDGGVTVLIRPNAQKARPGDNFLGRELVQTLPERLDASWKDVVWSVAPVPFHNGQVLLTRRRAWVSLHTLEPRVLALLGLDRVPVEDLVKPEGWSRYLAASRRATDELASLYGRPVELVHPMPEPSDLPRRSSLIDRIGGGAGFDLDSLVTFLEDEDGRESALVADAAREGRTLLSKLDERELEAFGLAYGLRARGETLRDALERKLTTPRVEAVSSFLDLVAEHLASRGLEVSRLPVLFVPVELLSEGESLRHEDFLVTWNNVVPERRDGIARAEGFASLLPTGDAVAKDVFARHGYRLALFPPLVRSIILNGGYRCASQHLRRQQPPP